MDPQTALSRALLLLLFLHLSLLGCRSHPVGGPGPVSELPGLAAGPSTGQGLGAAGGAAARGAPPAGPGPGRNLGFPGGSPRGVPRAPPQHPPGPAGPQDDARLWLLWTEAGPYRLPQRPGLQRAEEVLRGGPGCRY
ncbi:hypothetical protein M91_08658, partial [Bos mutus]